MNCPFGFRFLASPTFPSSYSCFRPTLGNFSDGEQLTAVYGNHLTGYSNDDVVLLQFYCQSPSILTFFPKGIEAFFPNLRALSFYYCNITTLRGDELDSLANLTLFEYDFSNNLERIPRNFFRHQPLLESICLFQNSLNHFGSGVFDHLERLTFMNLGANSCVGQGANNRQQVLSLIEHVRINCVDIFVCESIEGTICNLQNQKNILMEKNEEVKSQVVHLSANLETLQEDNAIIKNLIHNILAGLSM